LIVPEAMQMARGLPDRVLAHLRLLDGDFGGFLVDRLTHSLQAATLAHADGRDEEYVCCALLHDIGKPLTDLRVTWRGQLKQDVLPWAP
ncbi:HD domain-containing protein, partial [Klebsiella quasipneumoniae]|uniref:HD domain-containing protein n=1 Tax=Klebsiella quasipneumoniae TaxID=1463165 RepID=UPI002730C735